MKFTLKLQIDSAQELASFIQDMDMEIDMPFLDNHNLKDDAILDLSKQLYKERENVLALQAKLKNLSEVTFARRIDDFLADNNPPEQDVPVVLHNDDIEICPIHDANEPEPAVVEKKRKSPVFTKPKVLKPVHCHTCNKVFVPHHNKCKWCPECKSAKTDPSKKVKKLHQASD